MSAGGWYFPFESLTQNERAITRGWIFVGYILYDSIVVCEQRKSKYRSIPLCIMIRGWEAAVFFVASTTAADPPGSIAYS